jgi:hypothetical protein
VYWLRFSFFAFIGLSVACGDDDGNPRVAARQGCDVEQEECDIEQTSCLESLLAFTACARDDKPGNLPPIHRITTEEFAQRLRDQAGEAGYDATPWDQLLPELSLQPAGQSSLDSEVGVLSTNVLAVYDDEQKDVTIITDTQASDPQDKMFTVMHELTHYLQDRSNDFSDMRKRAGTSTDARTSMAALIEGEATVNSTRALVYLMRRAPHTLDWLGFFDSLDESLMQSVESSESPLFAATQFLPYTVGGRFVQDVWGSDDRATVDGLFDEWPHALRDWVQGPPWEAGSSTQQPLDCGPPLPPDGYKVYSVESFGVAGAFALLAAAGRGDLALAAKLQADAFAVYIDRAEAETPSTAKNVVGVWRLRFDSGQVARFADAISALDLDTTTFKNELVIRVQPDATGAVVNDAALATCPKLKELEPMRSDSSLPATVRQLFR